MPRPFHIIALLRVMKLVMLLLPWLMLSLWNRVNYSSVRDSVVAGSIALA
jgi:hypothetical protein